MNHYFILKPYIPRYSGKLSALKLVFSISLITTLPAAVSSTESLSENHKILIEELVSLVGDMDAFQQDVRDYHHKLLFLPAKKMFNGTILENDPEALNIMRESIDSVIDWEFSEGTALKKIHYQSFATDISEDELQALVSFYRTDLGKKVLSTKAGIFREWETNRNIWAKSLHGDIRRKAKQRLEEYHQEKLRQIEGPD